MISVIMPTFNGAKTLERTLEAFSRLERPEGGWSLIAIDNSSSDGSLQILKRWRGYLPLVVLQEAKRGKNAALNRAMTNLRAQDQRPELIVFTDDDVEPTISWLRAMQDSARRNQAYDVFGGPITPVWPAPPPAWLRRLEHRYSNLYSISTARGGPCDCTQIWGPNMAVRGRHLPWLTFDPSVGPDGTQTYAMGSDTEFAMRLQRLGLKAYFEPEAAVGHLIKPHHLEKSWVLRRAYRAGLGAGLLGWDNGVAARDAANLALSAAKVAATFVPGLHARRMSALFNFQFHRGALEGRLRQRRQESALQEKSAAALRTMISSGMV